jgi:hypothetical protein
MTDNELIAAVQNRMNRDANFRQSVVTAINQKNESWLLGLIKDTAKNIFTSVVPRIVGEVADYFLRIWLGR